MSLRLRLHGLPRQSLAVGFSPAHEAILSLHVLTDPGHHAVQTSWVARARRRLDPGLKAEVLGFSFLYRRPIATFWRPGEPGERRTLSSELKALRSSVDAYATEALSVLAYYQDRASRAALGLEEFLPESLEHIAELRADPERSHRRFLRMLQRYWEACLSAEWRHLEDLFTADEQQLGQLLKRTAPMDLVRELLPGSSISRDREALVAPYDCRAVIEGAGTDLLYLVPTYFAWPHTLVESGALTTITYPVLEVRRERRVPPAPAGTLQILQALADETRLQIVRLLGRRDRTTGELAGLVGISESGISKHLRLLEQAGLVRGQRTGYYVFYGLDRRPMAGLSEELRLLAGSETTSLGAPVGRMVD